MFHSLAGEFVSILNNSSSFTCCNDLASLRCRQMFQLPVKVESVPKTNVVSAFNCSILACLFSKALFDSGHHIRPLKFLACVAVIATACTPIKFLPSKLNFSNSSISLYDFSSTPSPACITQSLFFRSGLFNFHFQFFSNLTE